MIAFASCFPGSIKAFEIAPGQEMILQKSAYLAGESEVALSVFFNKKIGAGLFGGEGVFNTVLTGPGKVWLQTMPISNVAGVLRPYFPSSSK